MKIKMLTGMAGPKVSLSPGDEWEVSEDQGMRLIKAGFAAAVQPKREKASKKPVETR